MPFFEIIHEHGGLWRARRKDGLVEGRFVSRQGAVRFARGQHANHPVVIVFRD